ncbi:MAG: M81 family metallopeptidase [Trueperaceae bacterium]|nr:M81 family metallopeptidase [Trueperaceae bacterium]
MQTVLICECKQEVSTFNPVPSHASDFAVSQGDDLIASHRLGGREVRGALNVFDTTPDLTAIGGYGARAFSSAGTLTAGGFAELANGFLDAVRRHRDVDAVYFAMHGAMAVEGEDDPEGHLLAASREIVGEDVPIVVSLDLHGILTDRILEHADAVVTYHTYPHVDFVSTGERAARLLVRVLREGVRPVTAKVSVPALVRGDELITETGLLGGFIGRAQEFEASADGLSAGIFIGNPFTDVAALQSHAVFVSDGDPERAATEATRLAESFWAVRERLQQPLIELGEAAARAVANEAGTVILTDAADATSSGASGDSNAVLLALREAGFKGRVLAPIVDPRAVEEAFAAGVGAAISTTVGGRMDTERFTPMPFTGRVHLLSEGRFPNESDGMIWSSGATAVLIGTTETLVVTSRSVSLFDRSLFYAHGQDPRSFDAVVVKSPHCQPSFFIEWTALSLNVDAPGSTSANLPSLGHTRCVRPIFPLDRDVSFIPRVQLFSRRRFGPRIDRAGDPE